VSETTPVRYRKRPVVIEAVRFDRSNGGPLAKWCRGRNGLVSNPSDPTDVFEWIDIPTVKGVRRAVLGDYVTKDEHGEFYPCKPDIFEATYERVEDQ
jgi:hypothetical protein